MGCLWSMVICGACNCFGQCIDWTMSQAARFAHAIILCVVFGLAIVLGQSFPNDVNGYNSYTQVNLTKSCSSSFNDECIYRQLIYRASFALGLLFLFMIFLSFVSDEGNKRFFLAKLGCSVALFIGFWWGDNTFFSGWAELCRFVSFVWLLVQALLMLDFAHDCHELLMEKASKAETNGEDSRNWYVLYLLLSGGFLTAAIVGLVFLFQSYTGCGDGMFFVVLTTIMGAITTIVSMLNSVNRGLLTPCIMFAYSVFMCWYALLSSSNSSCNPTVGTNGGKKDTAIIITTIISVVIILYCIVNGTKILNIFNPDGEGVMQSYGSETSKELQIQRVPSNSINRDGEDREIGKPEEVEQHDVFESQSSGTTHERVFFHVFMFLVTCYFAMIFTSWGSSNGSPENNDNSSLTSGRESMWLKIVSQWVFLILYCRVLQVSYQDNQNQS